MKWLFFWLCILSVRSSGVQYDNITSNSLTNTFNTLITLSHFDSRYEALRSHVENILRHDIENATALQTYFEKKNAFIRILRSIPESLKTEFNHFRYICYAHLANAQFRLALGDESSWEAVISSYAAAENIQQLSLADEYQYAMAKFNAHFSTLRSPVTTENDYISSIFVLRFHIPQKYQTPSLGHFGHVMFDALYGVSLAYADNVFIRSSTVYVIDIGLYLIPALRTLFPDITFIPFSTLSAVPPYATPVDIYGVGMPSFSSTRNPFSDHVYYVSPYATAPATNSTASIRSVFYSQLQVTPDPQCLLLISRSEDPSHIAAFKAKADLDMSREAYGLAAYHDTGKNVHTAMHYYSTTAHQRRTIVNEDALFAALYSTFKHRYSCVKKVSLASLSFAQQLEVFASAAVAIGQHGAGMAWTSFMPASSLVIELEPLVNPVFWYANAASGVKHLLLSKSQYKDLYTMTSTAISVNINLLVSILQSEFLTVDSAVIEATSVPEEGYVISMIYNNDMPFVWRDSSYSNSAWAHYSRKQWHNELKRRVYDRGLKLPMKIMASPNNIYNYYDSHAYGVVMRNGTLHYVHMSNGSLANIDGFVPIYRQVSGVDTQQDIGFYMMDRSDKRNFSYTQPVIAVGEYYYVRITQLPGSLFFEMMLEELMCAALRTISISRISVFFSTTGAVTNLHYDVSMRGGVLCQLQGRKRILLWPPGAGSMNAYPETHLYSRRSRFNGRNPHEASHALAVSKTHEYVLAQGECIYIPMLWWHYVESQDDDTISVRYHVV